MEGKGEGWREEERFIEAVGWGGCVGGGEGKGGVTNNISRLLPNISLICESASCSSGGSSDRRVCEF